MGSPRTVPVGRVHDGVVAQGDGAHQRDLVDRAGAPLPGEHHPRLGEGARLVGREQGDRAQCLDRGQVADDGVPRRHTAGRESQADGHDDRQRLRHRGHHEADGGEQHQLEGLTAQHARDEDHGAQRHGATGEVRRQLGHPALQRGAAVRALQHAGDAAERAVLPGGRDAGESAAVHHDRPGVEGAAEDPAVGAGGPPGGDRAADAHGGRCRRSRVGATGLVDRDRLPGQRRLVHAERHPADEYGVGRHQVSLPQHDQVAGDELGDGAVDLMAAADGPRDRGHELVQRPYRPVRVQLLADPERGVDQHDQGDDQGVGPVVGRDRQHHRGEEHQDEGVAHRAQHPAPEGHRVRGGEAVRAEAAEPLGGLLRAQTSRVARGVPQRRRAGAHRSRRVTRGSARRRRPAGPARGRRAVGRPTCLVGARRELRADQARRAGRPQ